MLPACCFNPHFILNFILADVFVSKSIFVVVVVWLFFLDATVLLHFIVFFQFAENDIMFPCNKWKRFSTFLILTAFALLGVIFLLQKPIYHSVIVGNFSLLAANDIAFQTPSSFWSRDRDLLQEFQPALEEKKRQLRELFLGFKNGTLPTVKNLRYAMHLCIISYIYRHLGKQ